MRIRKLLLLMMALSLLTTVSMGQEMAGEIEPHSDGDRGSDGGFIINLDFTTCLPIGDFKDNIGDFALGFNVSGGYIFPESPFAAGINTEFLFYDHASRDEVIETSTGYVDGETDITSSFALIHGLFRIQPTQGFFQPYVELKAGVSLFTTYMETTIDGDEEALTSDTDISAAFSYGIGGGIMWHLTDFGTDGVELLLDMKASYVMSGIAEYAKVDSYRFFDDAVEYDTVETETNNISFSLGIAIRIN